MITIIFLGTNRVSKAVLGAHEGGIFSICVLKDGIILTGGKDRRIVEWKATYEKTGQEHEVGEELSQRFWKNVVRIVSIPSMLPLFFWKAGHADPLDG